METFIFFTIFILIIGFGLVVSLVVGYFQSESHKQRINDHLRYRGAGNITISIIWFDMDKNTRTYNVEYTNQEGIHCRTTCKIRTGFFSDGEIYWRDPP